MRITATLLNSFETHQVRVRTDDNSKDLSLPPKASGFGSLVNGGEFLLLSVATCYCNDIYREAGYRNIKLEKVVVEAFADFGAEGEPCSNISYTVSLSSNAPDDEITALINYTDKIAEVHNTIRRGTSITLSKADINKPPHN